MSPDRLKVTVLGHARGASRPRVTKRGTFMPPEHRAAESFLVSALAQEVMASKWKPAELAAVTVEIHVRRPARLRRKRDRGTGEIRYARCKPDLDNVCKLVLDACTKAGVWRDDTACVHLVARRFYLELADNGDDLGLPETTVVIWRVE
jgi:Holliday junction resolvase RusA-like endonuclease